MNNLVVEARTQYVFKRSLISRVEYIWIRGYNITLYTWGGAEKRGNTK